MNTFELKPFNKKQYIIYSIPGDGDCAYTSFIRAMRRFYPSIDVPKNSKELRTLLSKQKLPTVVKERIINNEWAEDEELQQMVELYQVCLCVWSEGQEKWFYFVPSNIPLSNFGLQGCNKIIYFYLHKNDDNLITYNHTDGIHYEYMKNLDEQSISYILESNSNNQDNNTESGSDNNTDDDSDDKSDNESDNDSDNDSDNETDDEFKDLKNFSDKKITDKYNLLKKYIEKYEQSKSLKENRKIYDKLSSQRNDKKENRLLEKTEYFLNKYSKNSTDVIDDSFKYTQNQKFLNKFISFSTNNYGILLYHGVGVGKTCSSVMIADNFINIYPNKVIVLSPSSLEQNYRKELFDVSKLNFENKTYDSCYGSKYLEKIPTWYKMSKSEINKKIQKMIDSEFSFFGYIQIVNFFEKLKKKSHILYPKDAEKRKLEFYILVKDFFSNRVIIVDEVHNIRLSSDETFKKFPKFFEIILKFATNIRLVLMTATPMYNQPSEISLLMNFLYTVDKYGKKYSTDIEFENGKLTTSSINNLKYFSKNYVSFMRGYDPKTFPLKFFNENILISKTKISNSLTSQKTNQIYNDYVYKFYQNEMKSYQLKLYNSLKLENNNDIQKSVQISNISYPSKDGDLNFSKGKQGFNQNFSSEIINKKLKVKYLDDSKQFLDFKTLEKYSSKMKTIIDNILTCKGCVIVYSKYLYSGLIPLAIALEHIGINKFNNSNILQKKSTQSNIGNYILLSGDESVSSNNTNELFKFNDISNIHGDNIKVALISEVAAEGVTFKNIREIHVLEPWYNMNKIEQIIGRGVRYKSHEKLPEEMRNVSIFLHVNIDKKSSIESIDERRYRIALKKQNKIKQIENVMKTYSIDCSLNININNHPDITKRVINSKGDTKNINQNIEQYECINNIDIPVTEFSEFNEDTVYLDILQKVKDVQKIITTNKLYKFDIQIIKQFLKNKLLVKECLLYMCKHKTQVIINDIYGYLIKIQDIFIFQPLEISNTKINMSDRTQQKQKFIENYKIGEFIYQDNENNQKDLFIKINDLFEELSKRLEETIDKNIIIDMCVDNLEKKTLMYYMNLSSFNSKTEPIKQSLIRGKYIIDDKEKIKYNIYDNTFFCDNKQCNLIDSNKYKQILKKEFQNKFERSLGYIQFRKVKNEDVYQIVSKIKHIDSKTKNTTGASCINTSYFKNDVLKRYISNYGKLNKDVKYTAVNLCALYEYVLRKNNLFMRPIEYIFGKN